MTGLTLCAGRVAKIPYYIAGLGMNIYSIEELCYCLTENAYILDRDLMDEKLISYLDKQLGMDVLAGKLKVLMDDRKDLGEFAAAILSEISYCTQEEINQIEQILAANADLGFAEKRKVRGDNLLKAKKYTLAIDEYQYVLQGIKKEEEPELYAALLHNTGTAYAQLFLFEKAAGFYHDANTVFERRESLIQYLIATRLYMKKEQYERMLLRYGFAEDVVREAEERLDENRREMPDSAYAKSMQEIKGLQEDGRIGDYYRCIDTTLNAWKQEYRKNMIVRSM